MRVFCRLMQSPCRWLITVLLLSSWAARATLPSESSLRDMVLGLANLHAPGLPDAWKADYAVYVAGQLNAGHQLPDYEARLEHFRRGFPNVLSRIEPGTGLELATPLHKAEIQWYISQLMVGPLPDEASQILIRDQLRTLFQELSQVLRESVPGIDTVDLESATEDALRGCDIAISSALYPLFRRPFTPDQLEKFKKVVTAGLPEFKTRYQSLQQREDLAQDETGLPQSPLYILVRRTYGPVFTAMKQINAPMPKEFQTAMEHYKLELQKLDERLQLNQAASQQVESYFGVGLKQAEQWGWVIAALLSHHGSLDSAMSE